MRLDANMSMLQYVLLAIAFGIAISFAIEYLSRVQIRAFYALLHFRGRDTDSGPKLIGGTMYR